MKVTLLVCDRCHREIPEEDADGHTLDVKLRYEAPEDGWRPFRRRTELELCPSCREAFAAWLGERATEIDGLRAEDPTEPDPLEALRARTAADGDGRPKVRS